MFNLHYAQF